MSFILEIENLSKQLPKTDFCLDNVSFSLPYGAIMGFIGENGAGKTTTISCILNTLSRDKGIVKLFGQEMTDDNIDIREDIGVVFDASNFSGSLTPMQLSKVMAGIYTRWDNTIFNKYMQEFHLPPDHKIKTYSKGMQMKLAIAVALSHSPRLLILDEATSGLDPVVRDEMLDVFLDFVQADDHSILLSSHITSDLEKIADYITFIHQGKIILTEKKDDLIYKYGIVRCKESQLLEMAKEDIVACRKRDYQIDVLVADRSFIKRKYKNLLIDQATIEDIMLLLIKGSRL